jgi:MFS family permease
MRLALLCTANFARHVTAQAASVLATGLLQTALALYLLDLTGSAAQFGLALAAGLLPNLAVGVFAGALVDRLDRQRLIVQLSVARGVLLTAFAGWGLFLPIDQAMVYLLTGVLGLCQTLVVPAQVAILPAVVGQEDLVDANAISGTVVDSLTLVGPVLSALLYSLVGLPANLALCALLYLLTALTTRGLRLSGAPRSGANTTLLRDVLAGFALFRQDLRITSLVVNGFLTHLFLFPLVVVGFPYLIKEVFHAANLDVGLVETATTAGSISSVLLVAAVRRRVTVSQGILLGILGMNAAVLPLFLLGSSAVVAWLGQQPLGPLIFFGCTGFLLFWVFGLYGVFFRTFYLQTVPGEMMGRFISVMTLTFAVGRLLGFQFYGWLLDRQGLVAATWVLAVGMVLKLVVHIPFMRLDRQARETAA